MKKQGRIPRQADHSVFTKLHPPSGRDTFLMEC